MPEIEERKRYTCYDAHEQIDKSLVCKKMVCDNCVANKNAKKHRIYQMKERQTGTVAFAGTASDCANWMQVKLKTFYSRLSVGGDKRYRYERVTM